MNIARLIITLFIVVSCSGAQITSGNQIPISFEDRQEHTKKVSIDVKMDYFLWGLVPKNYSVKIDELFMRQGYNSVGNVSVQQGLTFSDAVLTLITLGFYLPHTLTVEGKVNPYKMNQL